ncbi:uncharacterized protein LOC105202846 [Solenopsis invicta]|uniref:uncharacterized protein LOC105202846 n=1 Tax=Solenopsis invicta TaxID=13686 RepID=UPI00193E633F|nr:uncharacterized protein LOC105202846 [Solenopsis invicta]
MAENSELAKLKLRRRLTKASITRIETFLKTMNRNTVDIDELRLKLAKLEELWQTLLDVQIEITVCDNEVTEEQTNAEIVRNEEKYMNLKLLGERVIKERVMPAVVIYNPDQAVVATNNSQRVDNNSIRLPKIDLPTFSGAYEEWHPFFDVFNSLIHSNNSLKDIQKFHYLKSSLKSDAAETIASLEISDINYADAWSRLRERYENERLAVQNHIKAIFDLPTLRRENAAILRNILDSTLKHTRALQALKQPIAQWDDLLIHIISSKLDFLTIKEWENSLESKGIPKFTEFVEFLTKRCQTLKAVARRTQFNSNLNLRQNFNTKVTTSHAAVVNIKCIHCKGDHLIYQCPSFKELSVANRLSKIKSMNLCLNCFKGRHLAKDCTSGRCKRCSKNHSMLLSHSFEGH